MCDAITLRGRGGVERAANPLHSARVYARSAIAMSALPPKADIWLMTLEKFASSHMI